MKELILTAGLLLVMVGAGWALVATGSITSGIDSVAGNPIPEPSTVLLLGSGLVGLIYVARSRRRK